MSKFDGSYIPKSAMTIFAHPDDAEFTVGGTLAKWAKAGCEITMVLCTSGNVGTHDPTFTRETLAQTREAEQCDVAKLLGVKNVVFLRHDDCALRPTLELRRELVREIRKCRPEVVICGEPGGWFYGSDYINHPDHRAAGAAALEAVFPCAEMELFWPEEGAAHKVHAVYVHGSTPTDAAIDIADSLELKIAALQRHKSQLLEWDPTEMITGWAKEEAKTFRKQSKKNNNLNGKKGKKKNSPKLKYAEAFRVMTLVQNPPES
jgi:LmbE family N-acetylglucosaminyl deacetylase